MHASYHHIAEWGTNSIFLVIGEKGKRPFFHEDGTFDMRDSLRLGITLDERIADGYYYSRTVRILKHLLEHPELLDTPCDEEVTIDA